MYVDKELLLSDSQDLSQSAGSYYSTYAINLGGTVGDIGSGNPLYLVCCVDEAFTSAGSATVQICLIAEDDTTLDSGSTIIVQTDDIAYTTLTAGKIIVIPVPAGLITQQYIGVRYDIGTATTTAGTISAFIATSPPTNP